MAQGFVIYLVINLLKNDRGNQRMIDISDAIDVGARAFLVKEYSYVAVFVAVVSVLLAIQGISNGESRQGINTAVAFIMGVYIFFSFLNSFFFLLWLHVVE